MANVSNDTSLVFQDSADLVKSWADAVLPTGKTLRQTLTIDGISLWDIIAVEFAMYRVPKVVTPDASLPSKMKIIRPCFGRAKDEILKFFKQKTSTQGCTSWPQKPTVLFLGFSESFYLSALSPVEDYISKEYGIRTIVLRDGYTDQAQDSKYQYHWQHWDSGVKDYLAGFKQEFRSVTKLLYSQSVLTAIIQKQGQTLWPLMRDTFSWFFRQRIPQLLPQIAVAKHILETHRPAIVVSPDAADPRTRIYYLLCRKFNIPSLEIQFGLAGPDSVEYQFFRADHIAAFGQVSRNIMLAYGVSEKKITITGSPRHDGLKLITLKEREKIRCRLGLPVDKKIILFAASYYMSGYPEIKAKGELMTEAIFEAADKLSGACLVVKPHPVFLHQSKDLRRAAGARRNIIFVDPKSNIQDLIQACDVFVAFGSTATLDALIANKLTITPAFKGWSANDQFVESKATLVPRTLEEIEQVFEIVSNGSIPERISQLSDARDKLLNNWVFNADGQASNRICNLIKEMI